VTSISPDVTGKHIRLRLQAQVSVYTCKIEPEAKASAASEKFGSSCDTFNLCSGGPVFNSLSLQVCSRRVSQISPWLFPPHVLQFTVQLLIIMARVRDYRRGLDW
jgi:hypothetical protein